MALSVQRWSETLPAERPWGLQTIVTGDLGKNSLCGVAGAWGWEVSGRRGQRWRGMTNSFKKPGLKKEKLAVALAERGS